MAPSRTLLYKTIVAALSVILLAVVVVFGVLLVQTSGEYRGYREREVALVEQIQTAQEERLYKQAYLKKLLNDPEFFERVARERLGYSRDGELIIRFEDE